MTATIDIFKPDGSTLATITFGSDSYRPWQVMGDHFVMLNFSLPQPENGLNSGFLEIPIGSYVEFKGRRYTLYNPFDFKKNGNRDYEYALKLYAYQELTNDRIFINEPDMRQVFSRQARPEEFLSAIVRNMNHFDTGDWNGSEWTVGECMTSNVQQLVQFNGVSVAEALRLVAEAFKTEWEFNNKVISLRKVEYNKNAPLVLSYGQGNGFKAGLGRGNFDNSRPVHKLYVTGGERNIEFKTYGSQTLLLPKNTTVRFDGTYFEDETGYNSAIARTYQTSVDGTYLTRNDAPQISRREAFIELTEAYPKRVGTITKIVWIYGTTEYTTYSAAVSAAVVDGSDAGSVLCDIFDTTIPADLNYASMRIPGEQMVFVPQTGRLSGVELGVQQGENDASDGYIHSERRFKLITESDYGGFIPDSRLAVGDTYALFGMKMPQTYISIGERDLLKEAVRYKYENEDLRFTFKGEIDGIWAQANWDAIEDKIVAGGYVQFSDPQFQPEGKLIRISAIKEYLFQPYKPELELTNIVIGGGVRGELAEIPQQEVVIDNQQREIRRLDQRRWRDVQELRNNIGNVFTEFTQSINPVSVASMQFIAGNKMGQFRFTTSRTSNTIAAGAPKIEYNATNNTVRVSGTTSGSTAYIQHQTLGITNLDGKSSTGTNGTSVRPASEYKSWSVPSLNSAVLEKDKFYWVYARVSKTGTTGTFLVETTARTTFEDSSYYYLVVGGLNSEQDGSRGWSPLFGFTEILPGQITTGMIRSSDGYTYFDLSGGNLHVGNGISYLDWDTVRKSLIIMNAGLTIGTEIALNPDGSGHLASGKIRWDAAGTLYVDNAVIDDATIENSTLENVLVRGSIRSPFVDVVNIGTIPMSDKYDNMLASSMASSNSIQLKNDTTQSGRVIRLVSGYNTRINVQTTIYGNIRMGGKSISSFQLFGGYMELVGIGDDLSFYHWLVTRYEANNPTGITKTIGIPNTTLAIGIVFNGILQSGKSFDGSYLSASRISTGYYRVTFPGSMWGFTADDSGDGYPNHGQYTVMVWGLGYSTGPSYPIKATLTRTAGTYFEVKTSDDETLNDGKFGFLMIPTLGGWE